MNISPNYFVAIVGGAVAGSEAASRLAKRGIYVVVFDQKARPYGKIEDGLPIWHLKLRAQLKKKIDDKLTDHNIFFVPRTKLGRDIDFLDLVNNWGFSAVLLANGAWKDRIMPVEKAEDYIGKGLILQNSLVKWFNRKYENKNQSDQYKLDDNAIVIGGGLASLDVVKIIMLETVLFELKKRGIQSDIFTLERKSIKEVLSTNNLSLTDLGLLGCTLYYRRRIMDMPLVQLPPDASSSTKKKVYQTREKILNNFNEKYLFKIQECRVPSGLITKNGKLIGLKFVETEIVRGKPKIKPSTEYSVFSNLVVSSIGSIPEPISGINMKGELYDILDQDTGHLNKYKHVFALGNVVTGRGNIKKSLAHGRQVVDHVMDYYLAWREQDYEELLNRGVLDAQDKAGKISDYLAQKNLLPVNKIEEIINKIHSYQRKVGFDGDYNDWIKRYESNSKKNSLERN